MNKKKFLIILIFLLIFLLISFYDFQNKFFEDEIKVTDINLFGYNCEIYLSKIYLAYLLLIEHYYEIKWNNISSEFVIYIKELCKNINYNFNQKDKEYLDILYGDPKKNELFFFNSIIFNDFALKKQMNIQIKNVFNDKKLEVSYNLLKIFYKKNYEVINEMAYKLKDKLLIYINDYKELSNYKYLNIYEFNNFNLMIFFKCEKIYEIGSCYNNSISMVIDDDKNVNIQTLLHEFTHIWYNSNKIYNEVASYNYKNTSDFIVILDNFTNKFNNYNVSSSNNISKKITNILDIQYINFDEFIAYELSKYFCEKNINGYKAFNFAFMNKSFFDDNTFLQLISLSDSTVFKNLLDDLIINCNIQICIKLFILYTLCMVYGFDYSITHYLDFI